MASEMNDIKLRISVNFRDTKLSVIRIKEVIWRGKYSFGAIDSIIALMLHLRLDYDLLIGRYTAERIFLMLGADISPVPIRIMKVRGRNLKTGIPTEIELTSEAVQELISDVKLLTWQIAFSLQGDPPRKGVIMLPPLVPLEFRAAISQQPIELTGEFGHIRGLDQRIEEATGLKVILI